jgi:hypothetical protein
MADATESEVMFERVLVERGLPFERELPAGGKHPDYWVTTDAGLVVCEVTGMEARLGDAGGWFDVAKPIERKVRNKAAQGGALEGVPYVVVVHGPTWPADFLAMTSALYGRAQIRVPVGPGTDAGDAQMVYGPHAVFAPDKRTHISAVARMEYTSATAAVLDAEIRRRTEGMTWEDDRAAIVEAARAAERELAADGRYRPGEQVIGLAVFHNQYATSPLVVGALTGPSDVEHGVLDDGRVGLLAGDPAQNE